MQHVGNDVSSLGYQKDELPRLVLAFYQNKKQPTGEVGNIFPLYLEKGRHDPDLAEGECGVCW